MATIYLRNGQCLKRCILRTIKIYNSPTDLSLRHLILVACPHNKRKVRYVIWPGALQSSTQPTSTVVQSILMATWSKDKESQLEYPERKTLTSSRIQSHTIVKLIHQLVYETAKATLPSEDYPLPTFPYTRKWNHIHYRWGRQSIYMTKSWWRNG